MATYCTHRPRTYAADKLPVMLERWTGPAGAAVRAFGPRVFPGVPPQALLGLTSNAQSASELYCSGFCAGGLFQTPMGPSAATAPTPDSAWGRIARSAAVGALLQRAGAMQNWQAAIPDQVAIGLVDYREDGAMMAARIPSSLRPTPGTQWDLAVAVLGYVESNGARAAVAYAASALEGVPEARRFGVLLTVAAQGVAAGHLGTAEAYPLVRAWQRLAAGEALAARTGGDAAWFALWLGADADAVEHWLTRAKYGEPDGTCRAPADLTIRGAARVAPPASAGITAGVVAGVAAAAVGGWLLAHAVARTLSRRVRS